MKQTKVLWVQMTKLMQAVASLVRQVVTGGSVVDEHFDWQSEFEVPGNIEQVRSERDLLRLKSGGWGRTGSDGI